MKHSLLFLITLLLFFSCSQDSAIDPLAERIKNVETHLVSAAIVTGDSTWTIEERMEHYGVPGLSIAVINDYKIDYIKSYGIMDKETKEPVSNTTLFQAGSISKPVASYGSLRMVEQGKINIDSDINDYLTSWQLPDSEFTKEKKVSLKHLLSHTGGLTVHGFWGYSPDLPVPSLIQVLNGTGPANSDPILVDKTPEESFRYSGGGYTVMQQMLIDIEDGKAFPQIMEELVLQPLSMANSTYNQPLTGAMLDSAATGYLPDGTMTKGKRHTYPEMAAAGLWTTAEDLAKFAVNIQKTLKGDSDLALSKEMTSTMLTPFVEDFPGLGIFINKYKDQIYFGHGGWDEGFSAELIAHKDKGHGVVVLTNSNHPDFISELIRSVALSYEWEDFVPEYQQMDIATNEFEGISGRYLIDGVLIVDLYQDGDKLYSREIGLDQHELIKVSDSTYFRRHESRLLQFKRDTDDSLMVMHILNPTDNRVTDSYNQAKDDFTMPLEYLTNGNYDRSLSSYQSLLKEDPDNLIATENVINGIGYHYKSAGKVKLAQQLFKINTILYPKSSNVYDSYAEASMELGETELAIANYQKSIDLNPENVHAKDMIDKMRE